MTLPHAISIRIQKSSRHPKKLRLQPLEERAMLCSQHLELLPPVPEFDWDIEAAEMNRLVNENPGEGGPEAVSIVWSNRGLASDNFSATFGTSAAAARNVVDAAIDHWERVITNWNRSDGTVSFQVNISIAGTSGYGGAGAPAATAPSDGKPRTGSMTITPGIVTGDPNDSNGWYLDPNPNDHVEFGNSITNAFAGRGVSLGPDFYSVVSAELTHVLGLISDKNNNGDAWDGYRLESSGFLTNTNVMDNAEGQGTFGQFWTFDGPTVEHLMTSYNAGDATNASWGNAVHSAGVRSTTLLFNGQQWQGSEDVGNASFNAASERTIPSWTMAHIFADAYGYSIVDPERFDTFYANLNRTSGALSIRGGDFHNTGMTISDDVVTISVDGSELVVSVNVSNDIPGTRQFSGPGNLPAWTTRFSVASVNSISLDARGGNDAIYIYGLPSSMPLTVLSGDGNDLIDVGGGDFDTRIRSSVTVSAGGGNDRLILNDVVDLAGSDVYNIGGNATTGTLTKLLGESLSWNQSELETWELDASPNNDSINLNYVGNTTTFFLAGNDGNDLLAIGGGDYDTHIRADVEFRGGAGTDVITIDDLTDGLGSDSYTLGGNSATGNFGKLSGGTLTWPQSQLESLIVDGSQSSSTYDVSYLGSSISLTLRGNNGNDQFLLGGGDFDTNLLSSIIVNAGAGTDTLTVQDDSDGVGSDSYTIAGDSLTGSFNKLIGGNLAWDQAQLENFVLNGSPNSDTFAVNYIGSTTAVTVQGNNGNDTFDLGNGDFDTNLRGNLSVHPGQGTDAVLVGDLSDGLGSDIYNFRGDVNTGIFHKPSGGQLTWPQSQLETFTLDGSPQTNTIQVQFLGGSGLYTLNGNLGNDSFIVGGEDYDSNILSNLVVRSGAGQDSLLVNDIADQSGNDAYQIAETSTNGSFSKPTGGTMTWTRATMELFTLDASPNDDAVSLLQNGSHPFAIRGNGGNDVVTVRYPSEGGVVEFEGGAGIDSLVFDDSSLIVPETYRVSATGLRAARSSSAEIVTFSAVEGVTIRAGADNDIVTVANGTNSMQGIPFVTIHGGGGNDSLVAEESGYNLAENYRVSESRIWVQGLGGDRIEFQQLENVTLRTGLGNDEIAVRSSTNRLNGLPQLQLDAGAGTNAIRFDDSGSPTPANYVVGSSANGIGSLTAPASLFASSFQGASTVELLVRCGSTFDTSGYNPSHFALSTRCSGGLPGDFNLDGSRNVTDIDLLVAAIAGGANPLPFDLTGDGLVNLNDRDRWLAIVGEANFGPGRAYLLGDANLDGVVDGSDFGIWNSNKFTNVAAWSRGDFNADGAVDGSDFGIWNSNKFSSSDGLAVLLARRPAATPTLDTAFEGIESAEEPWWHPIGHEEVIETP